MNVKQMQNHFRHFQKKYGVMSHDHMMIFDVISSFERLKYILAVLFWFIVCVKL